MCLKLGFPRRGLSQANRLHRKANINQLAGNNVKSAGSAVCFWFAGLPAGTSKRTRSGLGYRERVVWMGSPIFTSRQTRLPGLRRRYVLDKGWTVPYCHADTYLSPETRASDIKLRTLSTSSAVSTTCTPSLSLTFHLTPLGLFFLSTPRASCRSTVHLHLNSALSIYITIP